MVRPLAFRPSEPRAMAPSTTAVVTQTTRGRTAMPRPIRAQTPREVGSAEPYAGRDRPEDPPPEDHQQGGQQRHHGEQRDADPDGQHRAQALGRVQLARSVSASRLTMTVPALAMIAGPARRSATAIASCRSAVPPQLLPVPRRQQQRVVGPRAEHQHVQDARALRVDGQARRARPAGRSAPAPRSARPPPRSPAAATAPDCGR